MMIAVALNSRARERRGWEYGRAREIKSPLDNKPLMIIEEIIVKYGVDATLFQLGSTNP